MERYAAFLRGVNVGAHHRVSNADLQRLDPVATRFGVPPATAHRVLASTSRVSQGLSANGVRVSPHVHQQIAAGIKVAVGRDVVSTTDSV